MTNLLEAFEATVSSYPDKIAAACREQTYTFTELKDSAARLGRRIAETIPAGSPVGVLVSRDADTVVLFLAVLYAGCFYAAIDPDMPAEKLAKILEDAKPQLILTAEPGKLRPGQSEPSEEDPPFAVSQLTKLAAAGYTGITLSLADMADQPAQAPAAAADDTAYMIYTSGSTGRPKGVLKSHGAVLSFQEAFSRTFALGSHEVIGNQTPLFFDASAKDLYLMLFTGATLEILPSELFVFPVTLIRYMNERKVTYVCWVPTALALVTQLGTFKEVLPETLKKVFFVGEVFPLKQLRKWYEALPNLMYVNLYGSTELAGICCWCRVDAECLLMDTLPMGKPLSNCKVLLMADGKIITEPEVTGEVYIESPALASCYYHDPEKTAQTFVNIRQEGEDMPHRMLASGDLACYDRKSRLHFVSRKDYQIKLMGRRIELGEIESAADKLPEVARCCCLFNDKRKKIILFVELTEGCQAEGRDIIHRLKERLSDYMVPSKVNVLEKLPLNANGKIDRTALKAQL